MSTGTQVVRESSNSQLVPIHVNPHRSRQFLPRALADLWLERCPMERYECRQCGKSVLTANGMYAILDHICTHDLT